MKHPPEMFTRGVFVGGNAEAEEMGLVRNRSYGIVISNRPDENNVVSVRWTGRKKPTNTEKWHTDLLEIIDR